MSKESISQEIKELETTYLIFNFKIGLCLIYSFSLFFFSKYFCFNIDDPTPILLWFFGLYGIVLSVLLMSLNIHTLILISRIEVKL